jgi:hypothetical protein
VLLAGLLFAGGALALFLSAPAGPTATPTFVANASPVSSLPIFIQPTPTPSPTPVPTPFPSGSPLDTPFASPSGLIETPPPSFIVPTPTPSVLPTPTRTPKPPTPTPSATPTVRPSPTPFDCAAAPGTDMKETVLGYGNPTSKGPLSRTWCVSRITISPWVGYGTTRLLRDGNQVVAFTCAPQTACQPQVTQDLTVYVPPRRVKEGSTLTYVFECIDDTTVDGNQCTDDVEDGATIKIDYEAVD